MAKATASVKESIVRMHGSNLVLACAALAMVVTANWWGIAANGNIGISAYETRYSELYSELRNQKKVSNNRPKRLRFTLR